MRRAPAAWLPALLAALCSAPAAAQSTPPVAVTVAQPSPASTERAPQLVGRLRPGDTVWATPGQRYRAGRLQRWVMGDGHRDLWSLPVPAQVLDLERFAGGLTPDREGGGLQTRSLRFQGADGRTWVFRALDKDAARTLDPVLRETLAAWAVQDRVSAVLPLGALVVSPLLEAAGVLHARPTLVVMPDDAALGEHRDAFARLLGWIEERPDEAAEGGRAFADAERVVGSERLLERLEEDPSNVVDAEAYLRARLLDFLVGDWDRHPDQWRWAGYPEGERMVFQPVPRDRDWAFSRLDGLLPRVTAVPWPHYVSFGPDYPSVFRLGWSGRALDRRILPMLDRAAFQEAGEEVAARITDAVIAGAVGRLPASYREHVGGELETSLRRRRDALPRMALAYHDHLAGWVDLHGTDLPEVARVRRLGGGQVEVTVATSGATGEPHLSRVLDAGSTREVRLYLHGGADQAVVEGVDEEAPAVRVIGGGGDDVLEDRTGGRGVTLHDDGRDDRLVPAARTSVDRTPWEEPFDPEETSHRARARDWGRRWVPLGRVEVGPDVGVLVGAGARRTGYGFRRWPWASRLDLWAGIATATARPVASARLQASLSPALAGTLEAAARGGYLRRFHGWGNDTPGDGPSARWEVTRRDLALETGIRYRLGHGATASAAVAVRALGEEDGAGSLVEELRPYGAGRFEQTGLSAGLAWEPERATAEEDEDAEPPFRLALDARWSPPLLDVAEAFGGVRATASAVHAWPGRLRPRLALRARGERVWGATPWHEAATLGGAGTLRGDPTGRWAGDAAVAVGADLDVFVTEALLVLPADVGVLVLADAGRVFVDGASPGGWHHALGAGVWAAFLDTYELRVAVARGERARLVVSAGITLGGAP